MAINWKFWGDKPEVISEEIQAFKERPAPKMKDIMATRGEGWETIQDIPGVGNVGLQSFNMFYNSYINRAYENELQRIDEYRNMASLPEVGDVIEDAVNESTQEDEAGDMLHLNIIDPKLEDNENIVKNITDEFKELFENRFDISESLWDILKTYYVDGRVFFEKIIDTRHPSRGLIGIKRLPTETMDYMYDPISGKNTAFFQYLNPKTKKPLTMEDAQRRNGKDLVLFDPNQIGFVNSGMFGKTKYEIYGYLEKARVPYNQLKLLETSVIIYRIIRAPERLVFRIDTGNMPRDKALKYVEKIKQKMTKKQSYDPSTGQITNDPNVFSILENYYIPQSSDGRGSQIESVGGSNIGFTELADVNYFQKKLYRALKYPQSRVNAGAENRDADIMFGQGSTGDISRDEIKWAKFLERQQNKFAKELTKLFLQHLDFKGLKKQYNLNEENIKLSLNPPSKYKEQMEANFQDTRFNLYQGLADREEMSRYYLMKKYLKWNDEEIDKNVKGMKKDKELGLRESSDEGSY